ncbi:MAG: translation initiation factor IF-3 [Parcubacteria group bacterium Athens0714_26]|nr:MAG: translation initiation factor IF-3 [Parcubacteria group bacterium Athens1014_26]TSD03124.1 MAG: translation initiation factor IF-3 [Parcubacteria group bacterium Athens0714_26]
MIRINHQIQAKELRVIDENGANLGVISLSEALKMAVEKGLDLIEISPMANPPVGKIMSFDKYRYQEEKKYKKLRSQQKNQGLKQVRISARAAEHDLEIKTKKVNEFLEEGHKVEIQMLLRGREKANKDWAKQKLIEFMRTVNPEHKVLMDIKYGGRGFNVQIIKK